MSSSGGQAVTGYDLSSYALVLAVWGICWMLFGSGLVYLLVRYFAREDAEAEVPPTMSAPTSLPAHAAMVERELVAAGHT
jgi:hypothetical protein